MNTFLTEILNPLFWFGKLILRVKLSKYGDSLKLVVPSRSWKAIGGWTNYSCKVISQMMIERETGYRGSKSATFLLSNVAVKEQRVDGGWWRIDSPHLRCTLKGFERNCRVKILSKQIINELQLRVYTSKAIIAQVNAEITHWFVTGFTDVEGCFSFNYSSSANW